MGNATVKDMTIIIVDEERYGSTISQRQEVLEKINPKCIIVPLLFRLGPSSLRARDRSVEFTIPSDKILEQ